MYKTLLFLVVLCFINVAKSQEEKILETYVDEILNLEYKSAYAFASNFDDPVIIRESQRLANILYYAGQEETFQPYTIELEASESVAYCIALLNKGFDELYHNPNKIGSFQSFFDAYTISRNIQNLPLQKLSLYGLLEFYHFQYSLTHDQFESYLHEFGALASSPIEKCWYLQYRTYFKLENVFPEKRTVHLLIKDLEEATKKMKSDHKFLPIYYSLHAVYFETQKLYEKAKNYHLKLLSSIKSEPSNKYLLYRTYIRLAIISNHQKEYDQGLNYIEKAENYIDVSDSLKSSMYIKKYSAELYYGLGNYKKAFDYLKESTNSLSKTRYYENNLRNTALEIKLRTLEKDKQILIEEQKGKQLFNVITILGIILVLGSIITFLYYRNTQRKQRITAQQLEIEGQKFEKVQKEQELAAIDAMILGQEKERETIASDLHDNVCALLSAAKMQFEHLTERVEDADQQKVDELFDKTKNLLDNAYDEVHAMAYQKNSGIMAKKALLPAVENIIKNNNGINGINIELQHFGLDQRLESSKEIFIFRIIQELIANIVKHAKATEANISITLHEATISIIVEDNGIGMSEAVLLKNKGLGIRNIKKRIESISGTMNIDSYTNKGTSIIIEIPR